MRSLLACACLAALVGCPQRPVVKPQPEDGRAVASDAEASDVEADGTEDAGPDDDAAEAALIPPPEPPPPGPDFETRCRDACRHVLDVTAKKPKAKRHAKWLDQCLASCLALASDGQLECLRRVKTPVDLDACRAR